MNTRVGKGFKVVEWQATGYISKVFANMEAKHKQV